MITSMRRNFFSDHLNKIDLKFGFLHAIKFIKGMKIMSGTAEIESSHSENKSNPCGLTDTLKELSLSNAEFFRMDDSENGQRLYIAFLEQSLTHIPTIHIMQDLFTRKCFHLFVLGLVDHVDNLTPQLNNIRSLMSKYDFDEQTPGNGYRSFVAVVDSSMKHAIQLCRQINSSKHSFLFRKGFYMREVEAVCHMIASLGTCFKHLHTLLSWSEPGELFPSVDHSPEELLTQSDTINQYAFYGRCLGIQFCDSVQTILKSISILMASFSETYYSTGGFVATANCFLSSGKFLLDPELRARRIVNISQYAGVDFCKSFWFLAESELMRKLPNFVCPSIAINTEIKIPPEPLKIENLNGELIDIPIPSSHIEVSPIQVRLISSKRREGMINGGADSSKKTEIAPPSPGLILHCHGGGFVAQSSKSHELYLRNWANNLEVPILSVDYSLAPKAPFPRALEEVFYTYCWALKNCELLGSTAERIILVGDSAGANLNLGIALKCIENNIRKPSGMFLAYVPVLISFVPSPARLLCLMDPLLPFGFMMRCLKAYACPNSPEGEKSSGEEKDALRDLNHLTSGKNAGLTESETESFEEVTESDLMELVAHKSPVSDVSDTLTTVSLTSSQHSKLEGDQCSSRRGTDGSNFDIKFDLSNDEKYVFDSEIKDGKKVAVLRTEKSSSSSKKEKSSGLFRGMKDNMSNLISNTFTASANKGERKGKVHVLDGSDLKNPSEEFKFSVPKDPFLSPYWASDEVLRQLPPTSICSVQFDPCLDDCVMFARKLKSLGNSIKLDILDGLPHGFLNFAMISKDAEEGSKLCVKRIKDLLDLENVMCSSNELSNSVPCDDDP